MSIKNLPLTLFMACLITLQAHAQTSVLSFGAGSTWSYIDNDVRPSGWPTTHNPTAWATGVAPLGYGAFTSPTTAFGTCVRSNATTTACTSSGNKFITTYFNRNVNIVDPTIFGNFTFNLRRDDGAVVYVNGVEAFRSAMPTGAVAHSTFANATNGSTAPSIAFTVPTSFFVAGNNKISVEVHQSTLTSSDIYFDLEIIGNTPAITPIAYNTTWKYLDDGSDQATAWVGTTFNDASWKTGNSKFGYGDPATTVVFSGCGTSNFPAPEVTNPSCITKYITTYFRKNFNITNLNTFGSFTINVIRDDGVVIYINGIEVARDNMPAGAIDYLTNAPTIIDAPGETTPVVINVGNCGAFVEGTNTIAVEVHQRDATSSDLGFNLEMIANPIATGTPTVTRNPYLQMGSKTNITVRWRTNVACRGRLELGTALGTYNTAFAEETCPVTEHEISIGSLTEDTKYFYKIGTTAGLSLQATANNFFTTLPADNTTRKIRIAAFGDCGRDDNSFQTNTLTQYQRFLADNNIDAADAMILLGDNAYNNGTEAEFTASFFNPYGPNILRNHKLYPAPGNHDYDNGAQPASRTLPYFLNFTMPKNGEIGGVPSGTEAYYSYNIGDIHFLALDSYGTEASKKFSDTTGAQVAWINADLAANTKKWVIAYWHHPPYSKGSHDSDTEGDLVAIRENLLRVLERNGVDLIMCGHSHDYERSYLLKQYYKANPTDPSLFGVNFNVTTHAVNNSTAKYDGSANSCAYTTASGRVLHGTVYVVSGSAGADGGVVSGGADPYPHNALPFSIDEGGMFYFEVQENRLDAQFINRVAGVGGAAVIGDKFTIFKDVNKTTNISVVNGSSVTLTASWPSANYVWNPTNTNTRSITVTPPIDAVTTYTVADAQGCIVDQFTVTTNAVLPIAIEKYAVVLQNKVVNITWTTSLEVNNKHYVIERSADGINFNVLTIVQPLQNTGIKNYSYVDNNPLKGISYYRLVQVDANNAKKVYEIKRINTGNQINFEANTLPTSVSNQLQLQIKTNYFGRYGIKVIDMQGKVVFSQTKNLNSSPFIVKVELTSGIFIWEVANDKGQVRREKVVIK